MARPTALWGRSGATTQTSPNSFIAMANALRPGAVMPSSLVNRMLTAFLLIGYLHQTVVTIISEYRLEKRFPQRR